MFSLYRKRTILFLFLAPRRTQKAGTRWFLGPEASFSFLPSLLDFLWGVGASIGRLKGPCSISKLDLLNWSTWRPSTRFKRDRSKYILTSIWIVWQRILVAILFAPGISGLPWLVKLASQLIFWSTGVCGWALSPPHEFVFQLVSLPIHLCRGRLAFPSQHPRHSLWGQRMSTLVTASMLLTGRNEWIETYGCGLLVKALVT